MLDRRNQSLQDILRTLRLTLEHVDDEGVMADNSMSHKDILQGLISALDATHEWNVKMSTSLLQIYVVADDKIIVNAPFTIIISSWNRISAATFFRKRKNRPSTRGAWPITGQYISNAKGMSSDGSGDKISHR